MCSARKRTTWAAAWCAASGLPAPRRGSGSRTWPTTCAGRSTSTLWPPPAPRPDGPSPRRSASAASLNNHTQPAIAAWRRQTTAAAVAGEPFAARRHADTGILRGALKRLARLKRESSNSLLRILQEWERHLQSLNVAL